MNRNGPSYGTEFDIDIDKHHRSFASLYNAKKQMGSSYGKYLVGVIIMGLALLIPSMINDAYASVPISSCGTLDIPGETYILTNDLTSSGTCFTITASGITLDGNGHTLTGLGSQYGVNVREYATGVTVKNMNISGFKTGIYVTASDTHVINNILTDMSWSGITVSNSCGVTISENTVHSTVAGIEAKYSTGIMIDRNNVDGNSQNGIRVTNVDGIIITGNSAITPGTRGILIQHSNDGFLVDNISSGNEAIVLFGSNNNTLINNTVESCSDCNTLYSIGVAGIMIWESNGNTLIKNNIESTHLWGVHLFDSSENTLSGNLISNHQKEIASNAVGLRLWNSHDNTFNYNTISNNERPYSLSQSSNNMIYNNNFFSNFNEGLIYDDSENNIFNLDSTIGGNYWDTFDDASEGCEDVNNDYICDAPFVDTDAHYIATTDAFAWSVPDSWLVNSPEILNVNLIDIPEAAYCHNSDTEPETPTCVEPEVLDAETNTCVIPEPEPPTVEVGLVCHIPPGNPENPQTIMISTNAIPAHLAHGDYEGACNESDLEIQDVYALTDNETLNDAIELLRTLSENLDNDSNIDHSISKAAELHKLFANEDKDIKKLFQSAFTQFNDDVKAHYGNVLGFAEKSILYDLDKAEIKIREQISNAEKAEQLQNGMKATRQFLIAQEELQNIKNQIFWEKQKYDKLDAKKLDALKLQELDLQKKTLFFTAKVDGEKISPELIKSIKKKTDEKVEENHKKNDGNANSDKDSKSNNGKGNNGKSSDKSGKGNSGKGNNGQGNNGKGKGK